MSINRVQNIRYDFCKDVTLSPEQREGVDFIISHPRSILGLQTGLGKTITALTVAMNVLQVNPDMVYFIICPNSAVSSFIRELRTRLGVTYSIYTSMEKTIRNGSRFFIFNYSTYKDAVRYLKALKDKGYKVGAIFDEIHTLQSGESQLYNLAVNTRIMYDDIFGMTATPLLNNIEGCFRVVDFVRPGYLGTIWEFKNNYTVTKPRVIRRNGKKVTIHEVVGYKNLDVLKRALEDVVIIKRLKYNLNFVYKSCTLTEYEEGIYEKAAKGLMVDDESEKVISARLHDLQRVADGSHMELDGKDLYSKLKLLISVCQERVSNNEGCIIFTEYEDTYKKLGEVITKYKGYIGFRNLYYITGKVSMKTRIEVEKKVGPRDIIIMTRAGCFAKGTKVVMADGSLKKVEDVKVGDYVMGRNSIPRRVEELHNGKDQMYRIKQSNAEDYIVNSQHVLTLQYAYSRSEFGFKKGDILEITAEEFFKKTKNYRSHFRGFKEGYDCEDVSLRIKPYFLGLWLGDGSKNYAGLCVPCTESQLAEEWIAYGKSLGLDYRKQDGNNQNGQADWYFLTPHINGKRNEFTQALREYGILGNKRIPEDYFRASRKQRLELLSGIINTDGWVHGESLGVSSAIKELAYDYKRLGDSLGYKTRVSKYQTKGFGKESVVYNVSFVGYFEDVPRLLEKKRPKVRRDFKTFNWSTVEIEEVGVSEFYGFSIEGPDNLFMLEDGTVVHNCQSINLQAVNNVIFYNTPFAIAWFIQCVGRVTRMDTTYSQQNIYILEVTDTIDTYKRLLIQDHAELIKALFGNETALPDLGTLDKNIMQKYRNYFKQKFLWRGR